jgi:hypothetical protein
MTYPTETESPEHTGNDSDDENVTGTRKGVESASPAAATQLAHIIYEAFRRTEGALVIGAVETRATAIDGEFDLIAVAESVLDQRRDLARQRL